MKAGLEVERIFNINYLNYVKHRPLFKDNKCNNKKHINLDIVKNTFSCRLNMISRTKMIKYIFLIHHHILLQNYITF